MQSNFPHPAASGMPRFIGGVFGVAFCGIGLTVLGFLWLSPFGQWDSLPLVFRIFGSFIAIVFVAVGGGTAWGSIFGKKSAMISPGDLLESLSAKVPAAAASTPVTDSYICPRCGAPLQGKADVSPSGDVKCPFCNAWFNIHQRSG
jgi:DNA-directed RNA polymerase subunit RPC12/RpoP